MTPLGFLSIGLFLWLFAFMAEHTAPTADLTIRDVLSALFAVVGTGFVVAALVVWVS